MIDRRRRRVAGALVVALILIAGTVLFRYQGLIRPVYIAGGSMAETLVGAHRVATCGECRFVFRCGLDMPLPRELAVCPNCGAENDLLHAPTRAGQRVGIDRWAYMATAPARGDLVAFADPEHPDRLAVKRIVGLPQEKVAIRGGELIINDQPLRKSLNQARDTAVLVHDDRYRSPAMPTRWRADDPASGWQATDDGYGWTLPAGEPLPPDPSATDWDWLTYRHLRGYASPHPRGEEVPVADNDSYNQGLSRELQTVTDLIVACRLQCDLATPLALLVHDGRSNWSITWSDRAEVKRGRDPVLHGAAVPEVRGAGHEVIWGIIDQQLVLAIDGQVQICHPYRSSEEPWQPTSRPAGIGTRGPVAVRQLRVYRDTYYLPNYLPGRPGVPSAGGTVTLAAEEYFVLGDNPPLSRDSRHWSRPGLPRGQLVGKVFSWPPGGGRSPAGGW